MSHRYLMTLLVVFVMLVTMPVVVVAEDTADDCSDYQPVDLENPDLPISQTINSPDDEDAWNLQSSKGDFFSWKVEIHNPDSESSFDVWSSDNWVSIQEYQSYEEDGNIIVTFKTFDEYRQTGEQGDTLCVWFKDTGRFESQYDYDVWVAQNSEPDWYTEAQNTPTPTSTPEPTPTSTPEPAPTPTPEPAPAPSDNNGDSGNDIQDSDEDGVIDSEDYAPNDPDVQEKSDIQDTSGGVGPGFGFGVAAIALLLSAFVALRRS